MRIFAEEIDILLADLELEKAGVGINFIHKKTVRPGVTWYGVYHEFINEVDVATDYPYQFVIKTLAHELRHAWQAINKRSVTLARCWKWNGSDLVNARGCYGFDCAYSEQLHEVDAFKYEDVAWDKLFRKRPHGQDYSPEKALGSLFL